MIYDSLENIAQYKNLGKNYAKAVEFLQRKDLRSFEEGKYEIDGKKVYATVSRYKTQDWEGTKWEAHRNYADIQVVLEGEEIIGYEPSKNMTTMIPYNPCLLYTSCIAGLVSLGILPKILPFPYIGLMLSVLVYAVGGGLLEVIISPIAVSYTHLKIHRQRFLCKFQGRFRRFRRKEPSVMPRLLLV